MKLDLTLKRALLSLTIGTFLSSQPYALGSELSEVCSRSVNQQIVGQRDEYCKAADAARKAADADSIVWKLYAATAAVCTYACAQALTLNPTEYNWCMYSSVGTALGDAYLTKQYMAAMGSLIGPGISLMTSEAPKKVTKLGEDGKPLLDAEGNEIQEVKHDRKEAFGPCFSAATAALQSFARKTAADQQEKIYSDNIYSAMTLNSSAPSVNAALPTVTGNAVSGVITRTSGGAVAGGGFAAATAGVAGNCSNESTTSQKISCALGADSNLPQSVADPRFQNAFQKIAKTDLGSFLNSNGGAADTLSAAMAGALPDPSKASELASLNRQFESKVMVSEGAGTAVASGGGGGHGGGSKDDEFGSMISGIMKNLMPGHGDDPSRMTGIQEVHFLTKTRGPASVVEAKNVSIFDRVSYRYLYVQAQFFGAGNSGVRR